MTVVGLIVGVMSIVVLVNSTSVDASSTWAGSPSRLSAATVGIRSVGCEGARLGTGVVVAGGQVWTAGHVIDGAPTVAVHGSGFDDGEVAAQVAIGIDWGELEAPDGVDADAALSVAPVDPPVGASIRVAGRAEGSTEVRSGRVLDYVAGTGPDDPAKVMRLDLTVAPGDSGGPVVDAIGRIVGLVYASEWRDHLALVIPVSQIAVARAEGARVSKEC